MIYCVAQFVYIILLINIFFPGKIRTQHVELEFANYHWRNGEKLQEPASHLPIALFRSLSISLSRTLCSTTNCFNSTNCVTTNRWRSLSTLLLLALRNKRLTRYLAPWLSLKSSKICHFSISIYISICFVFELLEYWCQSINDDDFHFNKSFFYMNNYLTKEQNKTNRIYEKS